MKSLIALICGSVLLCLTSGCVTTAPYGSQCYHGGNVLGPNQAFQRSLGDIGRMIDHSRLRDGSMSIQSYNKSERRRTRLEAAGALFDVLGSLQQQTRP